MATRYLANGASGSWFSTSNWTSSSGGAPGASVPTAADDVIIDFSGAANNVTIDGAAACLSMTFTTLDVVTTFTFSTGGTLTVSGNLTMEDGWSVGATGTFVVAGSATTGKFVVNGNFIHNSGTVTLNGNCGISASTYSAPATSATSARVFNFGASSFLRLTSTATATHLNMGTSAPALTVNNSGGYIEFTGAIASGITRTITYTASTPSTRAPEMIVSGGASGSTTVFTATTLSDLGFTGYSGTWSVANALTFRRALASESYALILSSGMTVSGTAALTFGVGNASVTTSGKTLTSPITINNTGGVVSLQDAFTTSNTVTHTAGELKLNTRTLTCLTFASSNSNTRTLAFGTGKIVTTTTATATAWTTSTVTGLTVTGTPLVEITGAGTTVRTVATGALSEDNSISFSLLLSAAGTVTFSGAVVRDLTINMATGILTNVALTIYGGVTTTAGTLTAGTNAWTFAATSGTDILNANGLTWDFPIVFNGAGGTWQLAGNVTVGASRSTTLTAGTLNFNGFVWETGTFTSSNSNVRTLAFGATGRIDFSHASATTTLLTLTTTTNLTVTGTPAMGVVGAGGQSRVITNGAAVSEATAWNFRVNTTGGSTTIPTYTRTLTQVAGTVSNGTLSIYGGFIWTAGSISSSAVNFIATSGTWPVSFSNLPENIVFNGAGGTWQLTTDCSVSTGNTVTLTAGTLTLNGFTLTTRTFNSSGSSTRSVNFGSTNIIIPAILTTVGVTPINMATMTGFTPVGTGGFEFAVAVNTGSNQQSSHTFSFGNTAGGSETTAPNFKITGASPGGESVNVVLLGALRNIEFDVGATNSNAGIAIDDTVLPTIYGNLTGSSAAGFVGFITGTTPLVFAGTTGTQTINLASTVSVRVPITLSGTGTYLLGQNFTTTQTTTLTSGTLNLASYILTTNGFSSTNSNVRTLAFGTGKIVTSGAWTTATATNLTVTGTPLVESTGTSINAGSTAAHSEANSISFSLLSTSASTVTITTNSQVKDLIVNLTSGTLSNTALTIYGSATTTAGTLSSGSNTWTFAATSGTKTLNSNGKTWDWPIIFNGAGGTWQINSDLIVGTTRTTTLTAGTLNFNGFVWETGTFTSSNSNVRTLAFGATGRIDLSSTTATTTLLILTTTTNLTITGTPAMGVVGAGNQSRNVTNGAATSEATAWDFRVNTTGGTTDLPAYTRTLTLVSGTVVNTTDNDQDLYGGLIYLAGTITLNAGFGLNFAATSGSWPLLFTNLSQDIAFSGVGGAWQLINNSSVSSTNTITLTNGTLNLDNFVLQTGVFLSNNSNTRTLAFGTGSGKIVTLGSSTVWDTGTITGLSVTGTRLVEITGSTSSSRTINPGAPSESNSISFSILVSAGVAASITISSGAIRDLIVNTSSTLSNTALTIYGSATTTAGTLSSGSNTWTFAATSGTKTLVSTGLTWNFPVTFNGAGGTWQLGDALAVGTARTITLTAGTLNLNDFALTVGSFNSSSTTTRTIAFGTSGSITLSSTTAGTTIWDTSTATNLTTTGTTSVTAANAVGTKTINTGTMSEANAINFTILTPATVTIGASTFKNLVVNNASLVMSLTSINLVVYGNFTITALSSWSASSSSINFAATSGTQTVTSAGKTLAGTAVSVSGTSTVTLADAFAADSLTLNSGALTSGFNVTVASFSSSNANARSLVISAGTWTLTGTGSVWDIGTSTGMTLSAGTSTILISNSSTTARTFAGGGLTYNNLTFGGSGSYTVTITGSNTFTTLADTKSTAYTIKFAAGATNTFTDWTITGTAGNIVTLASGTPGSTYTLTKTVATAFQTNYMSISDATATPSNTWYSSRSTDGGNNTGIIFAARPLYWVGATGTWDTDTGGSQWAYTSGGTIVSVVPVEDCDVFFDANSDSGTSFTVTIGNGATCRDMTVSGLQFTMTLAGTSAWSITGSLIWPASNFTRTYTGAITFTSSIANTITLSGKTLASTITFNGTGSWTLGSAFTTTGTSTTLTAGTLNLGSYTFTTPIFLTNNSNIRSINFGTGKIVLSLNSDTTTTIWDVTTVSNFAVAGTSLVEVITSSPTSGIKRVYAGNVSEAQSVSFSINSSDITESIYLYGRYNNLSINTASSDVLLAGAPASVVHVYGNFTRTGTGAGSGSLYVLSSGDGLNFASSNACTITTSNRSLNFNVEFSGSGSWTLQDTFSVDGDIQLTRGTFNANNFSVTAQSFVSSNSNVRAINMGSGTWRVGAGTTGSLAVWDLSNTTNLTLNADTSTINIYTQNSDSTYSFLGGGRTYNNLTIGSIGTASLTGNTIVITGANTFNTFASAKTVAFTIQFPAAQTTTFSAFTVSGTLGNVVEIKSSTPTVQATLSKPTVWYVGSNSTNGGNNDNLLFGGGNGIDYLSFQDINGDPPVPASSGFFMFCT